MSEIKRIICFGKISDIILLILEKATILGHLTDYIIHVYPEQTVISIVNVGLRWF